MIIAALKGALSFELTVLPYWQNCVHFQQDLLSDEQSLVEELHWQVLVVLFHFLRLDSNGERLLQRCFLMLEYFHKD